MGRSAFFYFSGTRRLRSATSLAKFPDSLTLGCLIISTKASRTQAATGEAPRSAGPATELAVTVTVWLAMVGGVAAVHLEAPSIHRAALFLHLVSLAVGFGAVVVVDVCGLLWVLGRRTAAQLLATATMTHGLITVGVVGLLVSGIVLHPDLDSPLARVKLVFVLAIMLNGVSAHRFLGGLRTVPGQVAGDHIPWRFVPYAFFTAAVSQFAWWGAILIGFVTTTARSS